MFYITLIKVTVRSLHNLKADINRTTTRREKTRRKKNQTVIII